MSQASSAPRRIPVVVRWLPAGGGPARPVSAQSMRPAPVDTVQPPRRDASPTLSRPAARKLAGRVARRRTSIECAANLKSP